MQIGQMRMLVGDWLMLVGMRMANPGGESGVRMVMVTVIVSVAVRVKLRLVFVQMLVSRS